MKKVLRSPAFSIFLMLVAAVLLATGTVGTARAVPSIESDIYTSEFSLTDIGVALTEEGQIISQRNYSGEGTWAGDSDGVIMDGIAVTQNKCLVEREGDTSFKIGKRYPLHLGVENTGNIPEFVRVTVYKYWVDQSGTTSEHGKHGWFEYWTGKKTYDDNKVFMDPALIEIEWNLDDNAGWMIDHEATTDERTVLYYRDVLPEGGTAQFTSSVRVNPEILKFANIETEGKVTRYVYAFDGKGFVIEVQVDAVQPRHGNSARTSAWGQFVA